MRVYMSTNACSYVLYTLEYNDVQNARNSVRYT